MSNRNSTDSSSVTVTHSIPEFTSAIGSVHVANSLPEFIPAITSVPKGMSNIN
jgi:hypothetical protein